MPTAYEGVVGVDRLKQFQRDLLAHLGGKDVHLVEL